MSTPDPEFAELHCLSNFSFLRAAAHPQELISRAAELGYRALAITDECSLAGVVRAWRGVQQNALQIKLIIGSEFMSRAITWSCWPRIKRGYQQLCQLITRARRRSDKGAYLLYLKDFNQQSTSDCILLYALPRHGDVQSTLMHLQQHYAERLWLLAENLLANGDAEYIARVVETARAAALPIVASSHALMHRPSRKPLHDCLTAIRANQAIESVRQLLKPNAENHLRARKKLASIYPSEWLAASLEIAEQCHFDLRSIRYNYPKDTLPGQYTAVEYLRLLVNQGVQKRFGQQAGAEILAVIDKELGLIRLKNYEHYFLTVYDIVRFAKGRGILCQGRGSAANSIVCYVLGITEVNPQEASLLFERFISESRNDPPDIDVDFEHERREEVIQYIYQRYGRKRAALAATVITYRRKSALRDVAKALGINIEQLEQKIANYGWRYRASNWIDEIVNDGLGLAQHQIEIFKQLLDEISGFPRHLSQHVGGFVITEGNITDLVPIENASMANRTVIQWDKDDLEALDMMKVDILALGILSAVRKTLDYIRQFHQTPIRIQDIARDDPAVFAMIQQADTVGVFQIESRAQMNMLPRLKPACYYDLVIQVAIVRPGPIHGDMVHPYLKRRSGLEAVDYPKPELRPVLERTLGIPIFQEQIIRLAMVAADFSADEANDLRRSMASWKNAGHIQTLREKLTNKMLANHYPLDYVERINRQIEGFGEYGFPESHAAGFALIAYISAWLKYHYPAAFCCALLNSLPMGFYSASQLVQDAQRHQVAILPADLNLSAWDSCLTTSATGATAIRIGLRRIKGLRASAGLSLLLHRPDAGYQQIHQLERVPGLSRADLDALASADALAQISGHRFQARWQTAALNQQQDLLSTAFTDDDHSLAAPDEFENLIADQNSTGLSLRKHILQLLREKELLPATPTADQLLDLALTAQRKPHRLKDAKVQIPIVVSGLITNRQMPKTATGVTFITLEDHTGNINVIVWLAVAQQHLRTLTTDTLVIIKGLLEKAPDSDVIHVIAQEIKGFSHVLGELELQSRNYH
ncbi:error-prone DNA polymerase [Reinekea sp.]|uniref:error-prone DNA polymerase n=1 Tax=Reinekea sp. TaxID=1970455 RepID=UPI00257C6D23|nr:error-prone DNA polymerase [Reinekea sp.]